LAESVTGSQHSCAGHYAKGHATTARIMAGQRPFETALMVGGSLIFGRSQSHKPAVLRVSAHLCGHAHRDCDRVGSGISRLVTV